MFQAQLKYLLIACQFFLSTAAFAWEQTDTSLHQGALWNLAESGQKSAARSLERYIEKTLSNENLHEVRDVNLMKRGVSDSYVVRFDNNITALMKAADPVYANSYNSEVAAYRLDKLLGLNFVPVTVLRKVNGTQYSLQLMYSASEKPLSEGLELPDNKLRKNDLAAFDYLLGNVDRTLDVAEGLHNFLIGEDGRLVAIDHARSFDVDIIKEAGMTVPNLKETSQEFRDTIQSAKAEHLKGVLKDVLSASQIEATLERLQHLQTAMAELPKGSRLVIKQKAQTKLVPFQTVRSVIAGEVNIYYTAAQRLGKERAASVTVPQIQSLMAGLPNFEKMILNGVIAENWKLYSLKTRLEILNSDLWTSSLKDSLMDFPAAVKNIVIIKPAATMELLERGMNKEQIAGIILQEMRKRHHPQVMEATELVIRNYANRNLIYTIDTLYPGRYNDAKLIFIERVYNERKSVMPTASMVDFFNAKIGLNFRNQELYRTLDVLEGGGSPRMCSGVFN